MYYIKNTEEGTIQAGGRKSNMGKIEKIRVLGNSSTIVVYRLGKYEKVYHNRKVAQMLKGK